MTSPLLFTRTKTDIATRSYGTSKLNPVNSAGMSTWNERDFDRSHLWRQCHAEILYLDENCAAGGIRAPRVHENLYGQKWRKSTFTDSTIEERRSEQFDHSVISPCASGMSFLQEIPDFRKFLCRFETIFEKCRIFQLFQIIFHLPNSFSFFLISHDSIQECMCVCIWHRIVSSVGKCVNFQTYTFFL